MCVDLYRAVAPMVLKRLTQTGIRIRFNLALSDAALCREVCITEELETGELKH
jgi:hypothetical protein